MVNFLEGLTQIEMWVAIIGAVLLILGFLKVARTKAMGNFFRWGGVVAVAVAFVLPQFLGFSVLSGINLGGSTLTTVTPTPQQISSTCNKEDTTVTLSAIDAGTGDAVGGNHKYRINNGPTLRVADAGTFTGSPGNSLQILWGDNATTSSSQAYFSKLQDTVIPCDGTYTVIDASGNAQSLWRNGTSITTKIFTTNNVVTANQTANETLGAGDVVNLDWSIQGQNDRAYPYGGVLTVELDKSSFDEENLVITLDGVQLQKVGTPNLHSIFNSSFATVSFDFPALIETDKKEGTITLDVDDNNNPTVSKEASQEDLAVKFYLRPKNYYFDEQSGGLFAGPSVEDEKNVATYNTEILFKLYYD